MGRVASASRRRRLIVVVLGLSGCHPRILATLAYLTSWLGLVMVNCNAGRVPSIATAKYQR